VRDALFAAAPIRQEPKMTPRTAIARIAKTMGAAKTWGRPLGCPGLIGLADA
jgi:hypothetical protein